MVLLSAGALVFCLLYICQIAKMRRKIIFIADENGICDYSRYITLPPIAYSEMESIEYKEFFSDDMSDWRHLKINLKDKRSYMKRLTLVQKISYVLALRDIEIHLFCAKTKVKELANILQQNLEQYNRSHS